MYFGNVGQFLVTPVTGTPPRAGDAIAFSSGPPLVCWNRSGCGAFPSSTRPTAIAITPDGRTAYVGNENDDSLVPPIDLVSRVVGKPIPLGGRPLQVLVSPDGATVYVVTSSKENVSAVLLSIDTGTKKVGGSRPCR